MVLGKESVFCNIRTYRSDELRSTTEFAQIHDDRMKIKQMKEKTIPSYRNGLSFYSPVKLLLDQL